MYAKKRKIIKTTKKKYAMLCFKRDERSKNKYRCSKRRNEASLTKLVIVQLICDSLNEGDTRPHRSFSVVIMERGQA